MAKRKPLCKKHLHQVFSRDVIFDPKQPGPLSTILQIAESTGDIEYLEKRSIEIITTAISSINIREKCLIQAMQLLLMAVAIDGQTKTQIRAARAQSQECSHSVS